MNDDRNDIVENLIVRSLTGESSAEDEMQLSVWIAQSEQNERHYLALKKALELAQNYYAHKTDHPNINVDLEWENLLYKIQQAEGRPSVVSTRVLIPESGLSRFGFRIAAAIVLLVASAALINYFLFSTNAHYQTAANTLSVSLPDGSHVILNRNSELSYSTRFGSKVRGVKLKGEAFFEVTHDPDRPFVIHAGDAEVEVLGTSFNVSGYETQQEVEVIVETGVVKLSSPGKLNNLKLRPGEKGVYSRTNQQVTSHVNDNVNFLSWKTQKIELVAMDLRAAVEIINKAYGSHLTIHTDVPASCVVTVTFDHQSLEAALNILKATLNLTYRIQGDQVEITHAGC